MDTVAFASTLPTEVTSTGMACCEAFAISTGTSAGAAATGRSFVQPKASVPSAAIAANVSLETFSLLIYLSICRDKLSAGHECANVLETDVRVKGNVRRGTEELERKSADRLE